MNIIAKKLDKKIVITIRDENNNFMNLKLIKNTLYQRFIKYGISYNNNIK